jgi:hypothetical protein
MKVISESLLDELVLCTVRYYLGRGSIAALHFPQYELPGLFDQCGEPMQSIILRDIREFIERVEVGHEHETFKGDIEYWRGFLNKHKGEKDAVLPE